MTRAQVGRRIKDGTIMYGKYVVDHWVEQVRDKYGQSKNRYAITFIECGHKFKCTAGRLNCILCSYRKQFENQHIIDLNIPEQPKLFDNRIDWIDINKEKPKKNGQYFI